MLKRFQQLGTGQRVIVFVTLFVGGLLLIVALALGLYLLSVNAAPRSVAVALVDTLTVREFAALPDDDAYPSTVATAPDGRVYTGSYVTGAVWMIEESGDSVTVTELPNTRELVGSVRGLTVTPDGTLHILDGLSSNPRGAGGTVWRVEPDGTLTDLGGIRHPSTQENDVNRGFVSPKDIESDAQGNLYVTDRGWREVWKYDAVSGEATFFWRPDETDRESVPTGLAFDRANNALIVTDSQLSTVYRVDLTTGVGQIVYRYSEPRNVPGFSGAAVAPDGTVYLTALDQNGVVRLTPDGIEYIVGLLRGASDIAAGADGRLYLTNFDSVSLVRPDVRPQLPFALDVVTFTKPQP